MEPVAGDVVRRVVRLENVRARGERAVEASLSSEAPVERGWGVEVLEHTPEAVNLEERAAQGVALLWCHDPEQVIGRVEAIRLEGSRLRGRLRFGSSSQAREAFEDVRTGILPDVSIGYRIDELQREEIDGREVYRVTRWTPYEVSLVSIAADPSVGVGRAHERIHMTSPNPPTTRHERREDRSAERAERTRVEEINAVASRWQCREEGDRAIAQGMSAAAFKGWVLENKIRGEERPILPPATSIGLSEREAGEFSFRKVIVALWKNDWTGAEFERDACRAAQKRLGRNPQGVYIPYEALTTRAAVAKSGTGGSLIATQLLGFIDLLRNRIQVKRLGATLLPGLVGDVAIPRQTGAATVAWVSEGGGSGESPQTFDQVTLQPRTLRARSDMTRKMVLQSTPAIEELVRMDLARVATVEIDRVAIEGSGSAPEPRGILNVSGIGAVAIGTNGGPPTWAHIVDLEAQVAADNADVGALAYLTNAQVRKKLRQTQKGTDLDFIWEPGGEPGMGMLAGYRAAVSQNMPADLTKGSGTNLSAILFGNFADLLIGEWGVIDLAVDPYALGDSGGLVVRMFVDTDVAVRHPDSFAAITDAVTT